MVNLEKELPNSPDAERAILGAMIINPELACDTLPKLHADDFYSRSHQAIFLAICQMLDADQELDPILLAERLRAEGTVHDPLSVINSLTHGIPFGTRLEPYIEQVHEKARLRTLMKSADNISGRINDGDGPAVEIALQASITFDELAHEARSTAEPLITSFVEFMQRQFGDADVLAFHAGRGEVSVVQSVTNHGKSTLVRNTALTIAAGGAFPPVVEKSKPHKVLLFNFEGAGARFQRDLEVMTRDLPSQELEPIRVNFYPVHAPEINGEALRLPEHMTRLYAEARRIKPDVIIIDTASAAFDINNENDNSEAQRVMKSLIRLARRLKCLVVLVHHIGKAKAEEGRAVEAAHRGRGASAWSDFATSIYNLEATPSDRERVILECAKRKDGETYRHIMVLNRATRWFMMSDEVAPEPASNYELVVAAVRDIGGAVKRAAIKEAIDGELSDTTLSRILTKAVNKGVLVKGKHGSYMYIEKCS
jgi:hypothetical protein